MAKGMVVEVVCKSGDHAFGVDMSTGQILIDEIAV